MALFDDKNQQPNRPTDTMYNPGYGADVDFERETVEGRIGNILKQDERGNYTNDLVRQAEDRQLQAFNNRGLLNTSMAVQGAHEAVISKAVDIASPDAKTYYDNRRANLEQSFQVRKSYQDAVNNISQNYQRQLDTINASSMTPEDKSVAIAQISSQRDGEITFQNNLFSRMPDWRNEWLTAAVPTGGMNLDSVSNRDTLANIANDPAQTQEMRDRALQRMQSIDSQPAQAWMPGGGGGLIGNTGIPSVGTATNGQPLPAYDSSGRYVNWAAGNVSGILSGRRVSLRDAYNEYAEWSRKYMGYTFSPMEWLQVYGLGASDSGPGNGGNGEGAGTGGGVGAGGDNF